MNRKKVVTISVVALILLVMAIISLYVLKNINEKPPVTVNQSKDASVNEAVSTASQQQRYTSKLTGVDTVHWGEGGVQITTDKNVATLSFKEDFKVAQGPDLFVYLSPNEAGQELGEFASLGRLQANEGAQDYVLPDNFKDYKTVVIWCRAFSVTFATAQFDFNE